MENRYKVLIADDDAHISELIALYMEKEGYEVTTYRVDGEYEDGRHPKEVTFTASLVTKLTTVNRNRRYVIKKFIQLKIYICGIHS